MDKIVKTLTEAVAGLVQEIKKIHEFLASYQKAHNSVVDELTELHGRINKIIKREEKLALMLEAVALKAGLTDGDLKELAESIDVEVREE
jgi:hypothetical protein